MQIIINELLFLREIELTDADDIFSLIDNDRERLREWLPFVDLTKEVKDTAGFIQATLNKKEEEKDFVFVIVYKQQIEGLIGFRGTDYANKKTEIGYWISKEAEGKWIVTQSTKAIIDFAFKNLEMNRVMIRLATGNSRSESIPVRLGFLFEGIERNGEIVNDVFYDLKVYSLLRKEWQK
jgi:ribosomal-protein-serine acetyltransferase